MKKIIKLRNLGLLSMLIMTLYLLSCENPEKVLDSLELSVSNKVFNQEVNISVLDYADPENIEKASLEVEIIGENANQIYTDSGEKGSNLKVVNGNIQFAVNPTYNFAKPLELLVKVKGDDYLTTTQPLIITSKDSLTNFSISLINKRNTPSGVNFVKENVALKNNELENSVSIATNYTNVNTKSSVMIEQGTMFLDKDGNPLSGGSLDVELTHLSVETQESVNSFPGGLTPLSVVDSDGQKKDISFETAGFVSLDMFVGDNEVKKFSKPINLTMEVPNDYVNPKTGRVLEEGDEIPIWSYENETGQWGYHQVGEIFVNTQGQKCMKFTTTHLSWYNLDFHYYNCDEQRKLTVKIPAEPSMDVSAYNLNYEVVYANSGQRIGGRGIFMHKFFDNENGFKRTPNSDIKVKVYYEGNYNKKLLFTSQVFNGCTSNTIVLDSKMIFEKLNSLKDEAGTVDVNVDFSGGCNGKVYVPYLRLFRFEDYEYNGRMIKTFVDVGYTSFWGGSGYIRDVELGVSQTYYVFYGGKRYEYDFVFDKINNTIEDFNVPQELCDKL